MLPLLLLTLAQASPQPMRFVVVAPAETLTIELTGPRDGPPVLVIPGLFGTAPGFSRMAVGLAHAGHRVFVVEPLGIGSSARPRGADYSLAAQAGRMIRILDAFRTGPATIVAHSVGAGIGLRVAALRPDLVARLISLEGGPYRVTR